MAAAPRCHAQVLLASMGLRKAKLPSALSRRLLPAVTLVACGLMGLSGLGMMWHRPLLPGVTPAVDAAPGATSVAASDSTPRGRADAQQVEWGEREGRAPLDPSTAVRDASQRYSEHAFAVRARRWPELSRRAVCMATHSTLDHLHHLADALAAWDGPLSLAVFAPDAEFPLALEYIRYLRACFPVIRDQVSFHIVYPSDRPPVLDGGEAAGNASVGGSGGGSGGGAEGEADEGLSAWSCTDSAKDALDVLLARRPPDMLTSWRERLPYPQNLMRNVARRACGGQFVLCPDVDMVVTTRGLAEKLGTFLAEPEQRACAKCAYVLPVYEVREGEEPPEDKDALLRLVKAKRARPFHLEVFWPNQGLSRLRKWEKHGNAANLSVLHPVANYSFWYEPVYVSERSVPAFDERFIGFGYTRNTQAYEMAVAGWRFMVLNDAFLVHWGYQSLKQRPPWRAAQSRANSRLFGGFIREVAVRYDRDPFGMLRRYQKHSAQIQVHPAPADAAKGDAAKGDAAKGKRSGGRPKG